MDCDCQTTSMWIFLYHSIIQFSLSIATGLDPKLHKRSRLSQSPRIAPRSYQNSSKDPSATAALVRFSEGSGLKSRQNVTQQKLSGPWRSPSWDHKSWCISRWGKWRQKHNPQLAKAAGLKAPWIFLDLNSMKICKVMQQDSRLLWKCNHCNQCLRLWPPCKSPNRHTAIPHLSSRDERTSQ